MTIDLRECKPGDILLSKHGYIFIYVGPNINNTYYPHEVKYPNGSRGTRTDEGFTYMNPEMRLEMDEDIVEILTRN